MKQYTDLVKHILENGTERDDRTNTGTIAVFGAMMRFNLSEGFPLLTTKKVFTRGIIEELLWFIKGDTNINYLLEKDVHIWDSWALKEDSIIKRIRPVNELIFEYAKKNNLHEEQVIGYLKKADIESEIYNPTDDIETIHGKIKQYIEDGIKNGFTKGAIKFLIDGGINPFNEFTIANAGDLGPVYGAQWRNWKTPDGNKIDQLQEAIDAIKNRPSSRRIIVTAWNPSDLPDESISPQENVVSGKMALAACHCLFQFDVEPIALEEITADIVCAGYESRIIEITNAVESGQSGLKAAAAISKEIGIPSGRLSCLLYQR